MSCARLCDKGINLSTYSSPCSNHVDAFSTRSVCLALQDFGGDDLAEFDAVDKSHKMMHLTEANSRLTKDVLSKNRECQDMQDRLYKSSVVNARLMDELSHLAFEHQQMKLQMMAIREENDTLHSQLSYSNQRWTNGGFSMHGAGRRWIPNAEDPNSGKLESPDGSPESWEEVSQKLLMQMKQEMQEMEDLDQRLAAESSMTIENTCQPSRESNSKTTVTEVNAELDEDDVESVRTLIQNLKGQSEHLKSQLITQGTILQSALNHLKKVTKTGTAFLTKKTCTGNTNGDLQKNKFDRPSDELFRAYFTQQLHNSSNSQPCQRSSDTDERSNPEITKEEKPTEQATRTTCDRSPEEKLCPVCEASFPYETPQEEFENHVIDHFESEASTLLQQYELL